jgi:hypothetical protein
LTTFDERGDMDYVDLKVGDQLIQRTEVYPFQFRYTPPASAVGSVVKLTAEAVDSAGNKSTRDLYVNVLAGDQPPASPVAVAPPTLIGTPVVGESLGCISGGFLNQPRTLTYAWLRNGAVIAGATSPTYTLTSADLGRSVACRITATNDYGSGDATSEGLVVSNPAPAAFTAETPKAPSIAAPAPAPAASTPATTAAPKYQATCKRTKSKKAITCAVSSSSKAKFSAKIRLQGSKKATASKSSKSGKVKVTVRSRKALKKGQKVVLKITSGKSTKVLTAKTR